VGSILSAKHKRSDRRRLLREAGLSIDSLSNIDMVDAALCAFAAHHLLAGTFKTYGDAEEGFIVVPVPV
jgi:predicted RNase H-like nuclease